MHILSYLSTSPKVNISTKLQLRIYSAFTNNIAFTSYFKYLNRLITLLFKTFMNLFLNYFVF